MSTRAQLGIDVVATDKTAAAFGSVQRFLAQTQAVQKEMSKFSQPMVQAAANSNRFAGAIQNVSFQVQDFAVQVASGTSVTRAFSQQAPQLLSGFGAVGAVLGAVLAVAIPLAGHFLSSASAMGALGSSIQTVAPYAAVATAALAGFYAPQLLAGLATTTTFIGTGLVGAIRSVTAAMLANPLGLLVAGVAAAGVAIFAFRDDITRIFGVDIVGVIRDSTNWTIDKFVKLAETIGSSWSHIGDIVGNAIVGAANIALRAMTAMVNGGISGINSLIDAVNSLSDYTHITLDRFAELQAAQFENPFAKGAAEAGSEIGKIWAENQVHNYVGTMASLASSAISKVASMFGAMTEAGKAAQSAAASTKDFGSDFADAADEGGRAVADMGQAMSGLGTVTDTLAQSFQSAFSSIIQGTSSVAEAAKTMVQNILSQLSSAILSDVMKKFIALIGSGFGGAGGGFLQSLLSGLAGARANGGPTIAGRSYLVGENGPEIWQPNVSGHIIPHNKLSAGNSSRSSSLAASQLNVTVINNSSAKVSAQQQPDGSLKIMVEEVVANALRRGGNKIDSAMASGYGLRRAGR